MVKLKDPSASVKPVTHCGFNGFLLVDGAIGNSDLDICLFSEGGASALENGLNSVSQQTGY